MYNYKPRARIFHMCCIHKILFSFCFFSVIKTTGKVFFFFYFRSAANGFIVQLTGRERTAVCQTGTDPPALREIRG